ncbi:MAG: hypothetical protein INQ03_11055 [Candidatus Heimdallarchaeota archaeon]|nr:hypothetical protein [Candidatus Heimdallarchaeota archaeon]
MVMKVKVILPLDGPLAYHVGMQTLYPQILPDLKAYKRLLPNHRLPLRILKKMSNDYARFRLQLSKHNIPIKMGLEFEDPIKVFYVPVNRLFDFYEILTSLVMQFPNCSLKGKVNTSIIATDEELITLERRVKMNLEFFAGKWYKEVSVDLSDISFFYSLYTQMVRFHTPVEYQNPLLLRLDEYF